MVDAKVQRGLMNGYNILAMFRTDYCLLPLPIGGVDDHEFL